MKYRMREGLVCRDIAGVYFLIDIHDRHFYRNKQLNCLNATAHAMLSSMLARGSFTAEEVASDLLAKLDPRQQVPRERVEADAEKLIQFLKGKGWAEEDGE